MAHITCNIPLIFIITVYLTYINPHIYVSSLDINPGSLDSWTNLLNVHPKVSVLEDDAIADDSKEDDPFGDISEDVINTTRMINNGNVYTVTPGPLRKTLSLSMYIIASFMFAVYIAVMANVKGLPDRSKEFITTYKKSWLALSMVIVFFGYLANMRNGQWVPKPKTSEENNHTVLLQEVTEEDASQINSLFDDKK